MRILITRLIILCVLLGGINTGDSHLFGQDSKKEQTTKKSPTKKQPTKKKSSSKKRPTKKKTSSKKTPSKKSTKKKPSSKKQTTKKSPTKKRPTKKRPTTASKTQPKKPMPPKVNVIELSRDFNTLTEELESSSQQLAHATSYLQPYDRKKIVKIENRSTPKISIEDLEDKVFNTPNDGSSMRELGLRYESEQRYEDAKDVYLRSIARNPLNPDNHYYLGRVYQENGELLHAQQAFEEALDIDPNHKATLNVLSNITGVSDEASMSNDLLKRSADQKPQGPASKIKVIQELIYNRKFADALSMTETALETYQDQSGLNYLKGVSLEELGQSVEAKKSYQKAIHLDSQNVDAHLALANHYYSQGKYIYAAMAFGDVVMVNPGDTESRYMQGLCYYNANEWKRSADVWETLLRIQPNHPLVKALLPQTYYIIAVEYNRGGEPSKGRNAFQNAMSINPNTGIWLPGSYRTLGKFYREKGMYTESLAAYQETVELRPKDSFAYLGLGITYWRMNEPLLAKASWERSLELNPENNEARGWMIIADNEN